MTRKMNGSDNAGVGLVPGSQRRERVEGKTRTLWLSERRSSFAATSSWAPNL